MVFDKQFTNYETSVIDDGKSRNQTREADYNDGREMIDFSKEKKTYL